MNYSLERNNRFTFRLLKSPNPKYYPTLIDQY
jgi:hypothetical protein